MARLLLRAMLPLVTGAALIIGLVPAASALGTPAPSTITLTGPSTATRAQQLTLTGTLKSGGLPVGITQLDVFRTDMDVTQQPLPPTQTDGTGSFTVHDTPVVGGRVVYTVKYNGDLLHAAATKSLTVTVSRYSTALTIRTDRHSYKFKGLVRVTAHLGPTFSNRQVFILARPLGGTTRGIRADLVDANGNLTATATVKVKTFFTVKFDGDERWKPAIASTDVGVRAKVTTAVGRVERTDGKYRVYSATKGGAVTVTVAPNKAGERVTFVLQVRRTSGWHTVDTLSRQLDASSAYRVFFWGNPDHHYRIRGQYGGDAANLAKTGAWQYAKFV